MPVRRAVWALLLTSAALSPRIAFAADAEDDGAVSPLIVTAPASISELSDVPNTTSSVTAEEVRKQLSVVTPEDVVRYLPNVLIRQRHIGDTQSPITTRTSGVGASARSLIYVDGILISSLIGNNNTSASPKWGLISPNAVDRVDVLNGPFAAAFPGNAIGSVISFHTRMPTAFEAGVEAQGSRQAFDTYGDHDSYETWRLAADVGDRFGPLALRLSVNHLDSHSQPLTYVTATRPTGTSAAGTPVTGAFDDANRSGVPIAVLGGSGLEHQVQDNASGRIAYDVSPDVTLAYTFGLFANDDDSTVTTYLRDAAGGPVYAGALNIGGRLYNVAASAFSNGVYRFDELQLAQGVSLSSHTDGAFDFDLTASLFDYLKSRQRIPTAALPGAFSGGPGTVAKLDDTGWYTLDAEGKWRPGGGHTVTFGLHQDRFRLANPRYSLTDWRHGDPVARIADSQGRTRTRAVWAQDDWRATPNLRITLGGRWEAWRAYDGLNFSATPALNVTQPRLSHDAFSPKGVVAWTPVEGWTLKGSLAIANRFPTVSELYQAVTTGTILSVPDPNLKPERALSSELSLERHWTNGEARVALFDERIRDTLISQSGTLSGATVSFVQNVGRTRATGVEVVARQQDVLVRGLTLSGWATYLDTKVEKDAAVPAAVGKRLPQLPRWRGSVVATYSGVPKLDLTLAARYSDRAFATLDNSDPYANTYQGFGAYFVVDAHARYAINDHLAAGLGVTNLLDRKYFLFHPFPQRTITADLTYAF
jgi:iron complex outermembrane receptor protein